MRISNRRVRVFALLVALGLLAAGTSAFAAQRNVAVLAFTGPKAAPAQAAVQKAIQKEHEVITAKQWAKAQKRLGARGTGARSIAKVAQDLGVDAVVTGQMKRKGARWSLTVVVHDGSTGEAIETITVQLQAGKLTSDARSEVTSGVLAAIDKGSSVASSGSGSLDDEPAPGLSSGDGEAGGGSETSVEGGTEVSGPAGPRDPRDLALDVAVGMSFISRNMSFNFDSGLAAASQPWGYDGAMVPGAYLNAEVYPAAFGKSGRALSGIGLGLELDRVLVLKSRLQSGSEDYTTTQQRLGFGLRYRWNFGTKPTQPSIKVGVGYNLLSFKIDTGTLANDLPNASYGYLDLGLGGRIPLGSPKFAAYLDARYLLVMSTGDMELPENYGTGSTTGLDLGGGLEYMVTPKVLVRAGGRYTRMAFDFNGDGAKTDRNSDGTVDVGGAVDAYSGAYIQAGYRF